ncbi:hypothetical protein ACZ90_31600 [Streptomyces albus subsp. albus]|nr:hypothetical protein ACZ90_31600 [Streptomyces albus subsp. albus]
MTMAPRRPGAHAAHRGHDRPTGHRHDPAQTAQGISGAGPGDAPGTGTEDDDTQPLPVVPSDPQAPAKAFDALYAAQAAELTRQAYLLTGCPRAARRSVESAFRLAWQRWPEVAVDRDPAGWIRAAAHEYALSPWRRSRSRPRRPPKPQGTRPAEPVRPAGQSADPTGPAGPNAPDPALAPTAEPGPAGSRPPRPPARQPLFDALLCLPRPYRRALLLYDGVGLGLPETAAESEATTPATANRLRYAHQALVDRLPELRSVPPEGRGPLLRAGFAAAADAGRLEIRPARTVRAAGERAGRRWTGVAMGIVAMFATVIGLAVLAAPNHGPPASEPARPAPADTPHGAPAAPGEP